jgi:hypothetical protein
MQILEYIEEKKPRYMTKEMGWVNSVLSYHYSCNIPPAPLQNLRKKKKKKFQRKIPRFGGKKGLSSFLIAIVFSFW